MLLDENGPGTPDDWLRHATSDYIIASQEPIEGVILEALCFHAQQAAEKAIKAVFVKHDIHFPYTHNISKLISIIKDSGIDWPEELDDASMLTDYALQTRYPGSGVEVTEKEYQEAIQIAKATLDWAKNHIKG